MSRRICLILFLSVVYFSIAAQSLKVVHSRCEYSVNPMGIDREQPLLSWELESAARNVSQSAYRILVADDSLMLVKNHANIWDSKKQVATSISQALYTGKKLLSGKKYYWKVMVWDQKNNASAYSSIASWRMGLLQKTDWKHAQWIAFDTLPESSKIVPLAHGRGEKSWGERKDILPMFRKQWQVAKAVKSATVFVSGLGHFEMSLNGKKVGDHFLDPGWTQYSKQAQYVSFDITGQLQQGDNTLGVMLGNGFYYIPGERYRKMTGAYGYPKMIANIQIEYLDGTTENIVSDASWKNAPSPVYFSSIYGGEDYDANREQSGWNQNGFNDASWKNSMLTSGPELVTFLGMPVKRMQRFVPVSVKNLSPSKVVYDLGQNFSGIPYIEVKGNKGDTVRIFPAELLTDSGTANQKHTGSPHLYTYVLKGRGVEKWYPRFTYYGFRYFQIETISASDGGTLPIVEKIEGWHLRNSAASAGSFSTSDDLFNKTNQLIKWAINSNMMSVFTDCPHREKLGWQEQINLMGNALQHNYDILSFAQKIMRDIRTQQLPNGLVPATIPEFTEMHFADGYFRDSPEWGSTAILFPWFLYQWTGDIRWLSDNYTTMQRYFDYLKSKDSSYILKHGLSDWYDLGKERPGFSQLTPMGLTATAYYFYDATILKQIAQVLGKTSDVKTYDLMASNIKIAFNKRFFNPETNQYGSGSQTSNAIPLYMGLVDSQNRNAVLQNLINDIKQHNNQLTAGDIGYHYLLKVLEEAGRSDVIYDMNSRSDVPGYGYQLKQGATALTESWAALPTVSNNHFMLGHLMEWFYTGICGINQAPKSIGFREIEIRPQPVGDIKQTKASYQSVNGLVAVEWKILDDAFHLSVTIPANANATIYFPASYKMNPVKVGSGLYQYVVKK